jgi:predicted ATPase with chaperone activity
MTLTLERPITEVEASREVLAPTKPTTIEETGISADLISSLLVKWLNAGEASGLELADRLRLPYGILEPLIEHMRVEYLLQVKSAIGTGTAGYRYALTEGGRERAIRYFDACSYVGAAPVPLAQYTAYMDVLRKQPHNVSREEIAAGFSQLIMEPDMFDQLGPAVASRRAVFLYGPPGNGKSVMGEAIGHALGGDIYVPQAIDVDGQIIVMYDPVTHEARERDTEGSIIRSETAVDERWTRVRRPVITVGGELSLDMLDLRFNEFSSFYEAPVQLKANGGVLVVDDFGRQKVPARDLLNRWIIPLEARIDYLSLHTGRKFQVPFDVMIVFATNLDPHSLADEAFLRRIPYKVLAKNPTERQFQKIFEMNCKRYGLDFDMAALEHLRQHYYGERGFEMRACHPRDLIDQIVSYCKYQKRTPAITPDLIDVVCRTYFIDNPQPKTTQAQ